MDTTTPYFGFSAQNMQTAIPEAVATDTRGYLTLSDRPILAALVNAFKDLGYLESMADAAKILNPVGNAVKNSFAFAFANGGNGPENYVPHLPEYIGRANGVSLTPKKL